MLKRDQIDRLLLDGKTPIQVHRETGFDHCYIKGRSRRLGLKQPRTLLPSRRLAWTPEMLAALDPLIEGTDTAVNVAKRIGVDPRTLIYGMAARVKASEARS